MISGSSIAPVLSKAVSSIQPVLSEAANNTNYELATYLVPGLIVVIAMKKLRNLLFSRRNTSEFVLNRTTSKFAELAYFGRSTLERIYAKTLRRLAK